MCYVQSLAPDVGELCVSRHQFLGSINGLGTSNDYMARRSIVASDLDVRRSGIDVDDRQDFLHDFALALDCQHSPSLRSPLGLHQRHPMSNKLHSIL